MVLLRVEDGSFAPVGFYRGPETDLINLYLFNFRLDNSTAK